MESVTRSFLLSTSLSSFVSLSRFLSWLFHSAVFVVSRNGARESGEGERSRGIKGALLQMPSVLKLRATSGIVLTDRGESSRERSPRASGLARERGYVDLSR